MKGYSRPLKLHEPLVCRMAGLPFQRLLDFSQGATRERLWALLDDQQFVDCLVTMNPAVLKNLLHWRARWQSESRPSNVRRAEMTLYRYLVRFCSRNDTTGFAGSTFWGRLADGPGCLQERSPGKRLLVYPSLRHTEMLCCWASQGYLRPRTVCQLRPCWRWQSGHLIDPESDARLALSAQELDLLRRLPLRFEQLDAPEEQIALELEARGLIALVLGGPQEARLPLLVRESQGTQWSEVLEDLQGLGQRLPQQRGLEFAELMAQADELAGRMASCRSLSYSRLLRQLVLECLTGTGLRLQLTRASDEPFLSRFARPATVVSDLDQVIRYLDQGLLGPGADPVGGDPWSGNYSNWLTALLECQLSPPQQQRARLLQLVWPGNSVLRSPLLVEAELAAALPDNHYARQPAHDRNFFICDSTREVDFRLDRRLRQRLQNLLQPWFRLAAWSEYLQSKGTAKRAREVVRPGQSLPLLAFLKQMEATQVASKPSPWKVVGEPADMLMQLVEDGVDSDFEGWLQDKRLVSTLDLMLEGSLEELCEGGGQILLAEAHWGSEGMGATTFFAQAHQGEPIDHCVYPEHTLFLQHPHPSKQLEGLFLQLREVVLGVRNPQSWWPHGRHLPVGELQVSRDELGLRVHAGAQDYRMICDGLTVGNTYALSSLPGQLLNQVGCYTVPNFLEQGDLLVYPEVRLGELVLVRWTMSLPIAALVILLEKNAARSALQLPRFVFLKWGHGKPVLCDLDCPFGVEATCFDLAKGQGNVQLTPMRPGPNQLCLQLSEGGFTGEFRFTASLAGPGLNDSDGFHLSL